MNALRWSVGRETTRVDIDCAVAALQEAVSQIEAHAQDLGSELAKDLNRIAEAGKEAATQSA